MHTEFIFLYPPLSGQAGRDEAGFNAQLKDAFSQLQPGCQVLFFHSFLPGVERATPLLPHASLSLSSTIFVELQKKNVPINKQNIELHTMQVMTEESPKSSS